MEKKLPKVCSVVPRNTGLTHGFVNT